MISVLLASAKESLSLEQLAYILKDTEDRSMRKLVMEVITPARVNPKNIR